jgi:hypothetical protein
LHRAKSGSGRNLQVGSEAWVGADIRDDALGAIGRRPSARRPVIADHREVVKELSAESALGSDPERTGHPVDELDVAAIRAEQRHRPVEHPVEERSKPGGLAEVLGDRVQPAGYLRLVQFEPDPGGVPLGPPRPVLVAECPQRGGRGAVRGFRLFEQASQPAALAGLREPRERLRPEPVFVSAQAIVPSGCPCRGSTVAVAAGLVARQRMEDVTAAVAATEEWVAETLERLARSRPRDAVRLRARAAFARDFAAQQRARLAVPRG